MISGGRLYQKNRTEWCSTEKFWGVTNQKNLADNEFLFGNQSLLKYGSPK